MQTLSLNWLMLFPLWLPEPCKYPPIPVYLLGHLDMNEDSLQGKGRTSCHRMNMYRDIHCGRHV